MSLLLLLLLWYVVSSHYFYRFIRANFIHLKITPHTTPYSYIQYSKKDLSRAEIAFSQFKCHFLRLTLVLYQRDPPMITMVSECFSW